MFCLQVLANGMECWTGEHQLMAAVAMVTLFAYVLS